MFDYLIVGTGFAGSVIFKKLATQAEKTVSIIDTSNLHRRQHDRVDSYFNYCNGKLPYRCLKFKHETLNVPVHQTAPMLNYPNEHLYTRCTEFKYFTRREHQKTSIVCEYPQAEGDPYYPMPRPKNAEIYHKYKALADATPGVYLGGMLATYRYCNMDRVVAQALTTYTQITAKPVIELVANLKGDASNLKSSNQVTYSTAASLEVAAVNGKGKPTSK